MSLQYICEKTRKEGEEKGDIKTTERPWIIETLLKPAEAEHCTLRTSTNIQRFVLSG